MNTEVLYSDLYPANFDEQGYSSDERADSQGEQDHSSDKPIYPLPRTAITCKRHPGFPATNKDTTAYHSVQDTLCSWALFTLSDMKKLEALNQQKQCLVCGESMDHFSGYYRRLSISPLERQQATIDHKRLQTRTGINRETGTVEEGILYNRMVFEEDVHFWGQITLPNDDELYHTFQAFAEKISKSQIVRLGTGRTRGLGKVALRMQPRYDEGNEEQRLTQFQERLKTFSKLVRAQVKDFLKQPDDFFFAVTLHAPLILRDELLRYRSSLSAKALQNALDQEIPDLCLIYQSAGAKRVTGWYELWGTPRTNEYAIEAGSVFLFRCSGAPDTALAKALFQLEEQGMGQRRAEGFGRICISDVFHSEGRPS